MANYTAISGTALTIKARIVCASCGKMYSATLSDIEANKYVDDDDRECITSICPYCSAETTNRTMFLHLFEEST